MTKRRSSEAQSTVDHTTPSLTTTSPHTSLKKPCQHDTRETAAVTTTTDPTTMPREGATPISAKRKRETTEHDSAGSDDVETTAKSLDQLRLTERKQDMQTWQAQTVALMKEQMKIRDRVTAIHQPMNEMMCRLHLARRQARAEETKRTQENSAT